MVRHEGFPLENTATTKLILSVSMTCMAVIGKLTETFRNKKLVTKKKCVIGEVPTGCDLDQVSFICKLCTT